MEIESLYQQVIVWKIINLISTPSLSKWEAREVKFKLLIHLLIMIISQLSSARCHIHVVDSLFLLWEDLGLEGVGSGEVDGDLVGGDLVVDLRHSLNLGLNLFLVEGVEEDLNVLLAIEGNSGWFACDGGGEDLLNNNFI